MLHCWILTLSKRAIYYFMGKKVYCTYDLFFKPIQEHSRFKKDYNFETDGTWVQAKPFPEWYVHIEINK